MSICSIGQGAHSPEVAMPSSIRMKPKNTFATMQEDGKTSSMKVFARVRPMLQREKDTGYQECVSIIDKQVVRATVPKTLTKFKNLSQNGQEIYEDFTYTQAFGPEIGQFVFFRHTVSGTMQGFIQGQNCLIFSCGITNSGKTFTLQGKEGNPGVIPLAMRLFFTSIKHQVCNSISVKPNKFADILILNEEESNSETRLKEQLIQLSEQQESAYKTNSSGNLGKSFSANWCNCFDDDFQFETEETIPTEEMKEAQAALYMKELSNLSADKQEGLCSVWVSFVEMYNEYIYDLLQPNILNRTKLMLEEDQNGEVYVKGAIEISVSSCDEALKLLKMGRRNLRIAAIKLNYKSSESHCIFTVKVIRMYDKENGKVNRISFCDLAGSEHAQHHGMHQTSGMHLKEAGYSNTSILVLGKCLEQLRLNQSMQDKKTLPLKESKLTRLFANHFLGKGRAVMIANVNPCEYALEETLNVLRFSALQTVKLNDSYPSAVSSSLHNITNHLSNSRAHLSDMRFNESLNPDNSLWEDIQEREDTNDKRLDLADSLRSNLEAENREKAELELKIRREYALYCDQLLENEKRISANSVHALKEVHETKISHLEKMYGKRIDDLLSELQEYKSHPYKSSMFNKGNSALKVKKTASSKMPFASPVPGRAAESEKSPLPVVRADVAIVMAECDSLILQLRKAEADLTECTKELDLFKSESLKKDIEIESLKKEKKSLEENIGFESEKIKEMTITAEHCKDLNQKLENCNKSLCGKVAKIAEIKSKYMDINKEKTTLEREKKNLEEKLSSISKQLGSVSLEIDQLKNDKIKTEEYYSHQIEQLHKSLNQKLEDCNKSFCGEATKIAELQSKCMAINKDKSRLEMVNKGFEEKLCSLSKQLGSASSEIDQLKNDKIKAKEYYSHQIEQLQERLNITLGHCKKLEDCNKSLCGEVNKIAELQSKCMAINKDKTKLEIEKKELEEKLCSVSKKLENEAELCEQLNEQLEDINKGVQGKETKIIRLEEDCAALKSNNSELSKNLEVANEKYSVLSEKHGTQDLKCQDLTNQLEAFNNVISDQKTQVIQLQEECTILKNENAALSSTSSIEKEKCAALSEEHGLLKIDFENFKQDKLAEADAHAKYVKELQECISEKEEKIKEITDTLQNLENEDKLKNENIRAYKEEIVKLKEELEKAKLLQGQYAKLEEKSAENEESMKKYTEIITKLEENISEKEEKIKEITDTLQNLENEDKLKNENIGAYKEEIVEELEKAKLLLTQFAKLEEKSAENEKAMKIYAEKIVQLEESISEKESRIKELTENVLALENYKLEFQNKESDVASCKEEIVNLKEELEMAKLWKEQYDILCVLCESLERCEFFASNKIKLLSSSSSKHLDELTDMRRQIKENNAHIDELEKGISEKEGRIKELTENILTLENCKLEFQKKESDVASYKEEIVNLKEELEKAKLFKEQYDLLCVLCDYLERCEFLASNKIKLLGSSDEINDMRRQITENNAHIDELEKESRRPEFQNNEIDTSYKEEIVSLKGELEEAKLLNEQSGMLCEYLERCEFLASNKIKMLDSSSIKHLDVITGMRRQIEEKNAHIDKLEKALSDGQKQVESVQNDVKPQKVTVRNSIRWKAPPIATTITKEPLLKVTRSTTNKILKKTSNTQIKSEKHVETEERPVFLENTSRKSLKKSNSQSALEMVSTLTNSSSPQCGYTSSKHEVVIASQKHPITNATVAATAKRPELTITLSSTNTVVENVKVLPTALNYCNSKSLSRGTQNLSKHFKLSSISTPKIHTEVNKKLNVGITNANITSSPLIPESHNQIKLLAAGTTIVPISSTTLAKIPASLLISRLPRILPGGSISPLSEEGANSKVTSTKSEKSTKTTKEDVPTSLLVSLCKTGVTVTSTSENAMNEKISETRIETKSSKDKKDSQAANLVNAGVTITNSLNNVATVNKLTDRSKTSTNRRSQRNLVFIENSVSNIAADSDVVITHDRTKLNEHVKLLNENKATRTKLNNEKNIKYSSTVASKRSLEFMASNNIKNIEIINISKSSANKSLNTSIKKRQLNKHVSSLFVDELVNKSKDIDSNLSTDLNAEIKIEEVEEEKRRRKRSLSDVNKVDTSDTEGNETTPKRRRSLRNHSTT